MRVSYPVMIMVVRRLIKSLFTKKPLTGCIGERLIKPRLLVHAGSSCCHAMVHLVPKRGAKLVMTSMFATYVYQIAAHTGRIDTRRILQVPAYLIGNQRVDRHSKAVNTGFVRHWSNFANVSDFLRRHTYYGQNQLPFPQAITRCMPSTGPFLAMCTTRRVDCFPSYHSLQGDGHTVRRRLVAIERTSGAAFNSGRRGQSSMSPPRLPIRHMSSGTTIQQRGSRRSDTSAATSLMTTVTLLRPLGMAGPPGDHPGGGPLWNPGSNGSEISIGPSSGLPLPHNKLAGQVIDSQ